MQCAVNTALGTGSNPADASGRVLIRRLAVTVLFDGTATLNDHLITFVEGFSSIGL